MRGRFLRGLFLFLLVACRDHSSAAEPAAGKTPPVSTAGGASGPTASGPTAGPPKITEVLYQGKFENGWLDYGWSPREVNKGPAKIDLTHYGGWILGKPGKKQGFGGLRFKVRTADAPDYEVRVEGQGSFPKLQLVQFEPISEAGGWSEYFLPMVMLNPRAADFEQVVFQGKRKGKFVAAQIDEVGLTAVVDGAPLTGGPSVETKLSLDCQAKAKPISPFIYGIAYDHQRADDDTGVDLNVSIRRWGGNHTSRYNWQLGNAWNTANDYFFMNVNYTGKKDYSYETFFEQQGKWGMKTALTVPMIGWVAKDTSSVSFAKAAFPRQEKFDPETEKAGNGNSLDGKPIDPPAPSTTSVAAPPEFIGKWIEAIRARDKASGRGRAVNLYFLDNEPALWSHTHRDVHPQPVGYDELWERTLNYARAIRKADPDAIIAGPSEWGWTNFMHSAVDSTAGKTFLRPDRRKHEDLPIVAWWLKKAAEHEKKTGERLVDVFDLHFYPQQTDLGIGSTGKTDNKTSALRIRSTRGLWDATYKDESWINDTVKLLPRMREWIADHYPGRGISIGEYNFGADLHASGGLAQAEALGRFGTEGVQYAFVWYWPPKGSAAAQGFKAFRNYDGKGATFLDQSIPAKASGPVSLFASRDATTSKLVLVALNTDPVNAAIGAIKLEHCGPVGVQRAFQTTFGPRGLEPVKMNPDRVVLPPYSITVFELTLAATDLLK